MAAVRIECERRPRFGLMLVSYYASDRASLPASSQRGCPRQARGFETTALAPEGCPLLAPCRAKSYSRGRSWPRRHRPSHTPRRRRPSPSHTPRPNQYMGSHSLYTLSPHLSRCRRAALPVRPAVPAGMMPGSVFNVQANGDDTVRFPWAANLVGSCQVAVPPGRWFSSRSCSNRARRSQRHAASRRAGSSARRARRRHLVPAAMLAGSITILVG